MIEFNFDLTPASRLLVGTGSLLEERGKFGDTLL
jgi:hypothetical protein